MANSSNKIGIGICTFNRPQYLKQCLEHLLKNITSVDRVVIYNDGSLEKHKKNYEAAYRVLDVNRNFSLDIRDMPTNQGVAHAKNTLLDRLISWGCDDVFLLEDDILLLDDKAITEYIRIGKEYDYQHFMFAHHGEANKDGPVYPRVEFAEKDEVEYYPACVGAWCYYTRQCLLGLKEIEKKKLTATGKPFPFPGLMDENFKNAWEHVEHTKRLGDAGFTSWFGLFVDIKDSKKYISEIPGSIEQSSIRPQGGWKQNQIDGLKYWTEKDGQAPPIELPKE